MDNAAISRMYCEHNGCGLRLRGSDIERRVDGAGRRVYVVTYTCEAEHETELIVPRDEVRE